MELSCARWSSAAKGIGVLVAMDMDKGDLDWQLQRRLWQAQSRLAHLDEQEMVSLG